MYAPRVLPVARGYHALYRSFRWQVPARYNIGVDVCDRWAELEPGRTARLGKFQVRAIRSPHTKPDISLSFRVTAGSKSIVFSGDSGWNDELVKLSDGADLFLCECTYYESAELDFHLNYPLLAANRDKFKVRRMVLTHLGREVLSRENEIAIEMGFDGMKIEI